MTGQYQVREDMKVSRCGISLCLISIRKDNDAYESTMLYFQPFQNGRRSNYWGGCKTWTNQHGTMEFCVPTDVYNTFTNIYEKNKKYEHVGQFKFKIHILFHADNSWTVALRQIQFGTVKDHGHTYSLIWTVILLD
jgi:hypothetical protein